MKASFNEEEQTLDRLLKLETEFRDFYQCSRKELQMQTEWCNRMSILSQRYLILSNSNSKGCYRHHKGCASSTEMVLLKEYHLNYKVVLSSNERMDKNLQMLRVSCRAFEEDCSRLDMSAESPFILGDNFHKPIKYFIELVSDLFNYFNCQLLKLSSMFALLDPIDVGTLKNYMSLLRPSEEFEEYLMVGLNYCKCLKQRPVCHNRGISKFCPELDKRASEN